MRSSSRRWNAFVTHSHGLNSRRTSYSVSRQQPSLSSPDAMQRSLRVQPTEWTQRLLSWSTQSTPEVVGRLTIPKQDMRSPRGQKLNEYVEALSFDPWHALVEHRQLGDMASSVDRARPSHGFTISPMTQGFRRVHRGDFEHGEH